MFFQCQLRKQMNETYLILALHKKLSPLFDHIKNPSLASVGALGWALNTLGML